MDEDRRTRRLTLVEREAPVAWERVLRRWKEPTAAVWFTEILAHAPFSAFFWECPPLTRSRLGQPFDCVLVDSPFLATLTPDPGPFSEWFTSADPVVGFDNLGGDAHLVAPCPHQAVDATHLASFVRTAPPELASPFWGTVSRAVGARLGERPLWISTCGVGVAWLHLRLDRTPKYYTYPPFRRL